jgi:tetratricopeptide (TPR) repeat protein
MGSRIHLAALAAVLSLSSPARAVVDLPAPSPTEAELLGKAKALSDEGKYAEAERLLAHATSPMLRWSRAVIVSRQGRYTEAAAALRAIAAEVGGKLELRDSDGWLLLAAAWKAPPEALAAHARGFHLSTQGRCEEAKASLEEALRRAPGLVDARYHLGYCLSKLGDAEGAERQLRTAIAGYARSDRFLRASAEYTLGNLLWQRGREEAKEALTLLRSAASPEGQGRLPGVLLALAQAHAAAGDEPGSRAAFAEMIERIEAGEGREIPPETAADVRSLLSWAGCARRPARSADGVPPRCAARAAFERAALASRALGDGKAAEAEKAARDATALEPTYGMAWFLLGRSLLDQERLPDAEAAFRKAREHRGWLDARQGAGASALLAHTLVERGSASGEAVRLAVEAATAAVAPDDAAARARYETLIGRAFEASGNRACALEHLRTAAGLAGAPDELRMRAQALVTEVKATPADRPDCFEFQLYAPETLSAFWRRYRTDHPLERFEKPTVLYEYHPMERLRVRVRFTGAHRAVSEPIARLLTVDRGRTAPIGANITWSQLGAQYHGEMEVVEKGASRWIVVSDGLRESLASELPGGGEADAYLAFFGVVDDAPMLFLTEFDASARGPG